MSWKLSLTSKRVYNLIATLVGIGLLIVLAFSLNALFASRSQPPIQKRSSPSPSDSSQLSSPTNSSVPDETGTTTSPVPGSQTKQTTVEWEIYSIELYNLKLALPAQWTLDEINRRPEPTRSFDPIMGHDCADYQIASSNRYVILKLHPSCGFANSTFKQWPKDTVVVKKLEDDRFVIRFFDPESLVYRYATGGEATLSDEKGTRKEKMHGNIVNLGSRENPTFISIELRYLGPDSSRDQYLQLVDKVVQSLRLTESVSS